MAHALFAALLVVCLPTSTVSFSATPSRFAAAQLGGRASAPCMMPRSKGPFALPDPPADFAGAQWASHCFPPFPPYEYKVATKPASNIVPAKVTPAPAPPAPAPAPDVSKSTFTVTLKTPDGDKAFECPPDMYLLDQTEELDNADDFADLPYACRAGSCSACAGKLVSGTVDTSACSFLTDEQKKDGWVLTCTCKPTSDCVIETDKEDDLY